MDREFLAILTKFLVESIAKEGPPYNPESASSNLQILLKAAEAAKPLTPAQRHANATERHIDDVCKERDRMAAELAAAHESHAVAILELRRELNLVIESHRDRLGWFEPHYEGLKRDYDNIKSLNFSYLSMTAGGGLLMGLASVTTGDALKFCLLAVGVVLTCCGLWTQSIVVYKSPASKERPAVG